MLESNIKTLYSSDGDKITTIESTYAVKGVTTLWHVLYSQRPALFDIFVFVSALVMQDITIHCKINKTAVSLHYVKVTRNVARCKILVGVMIQ